MNSGRPALAAALYAVCAMLFATLVAPSATTPEKTKKCLDLNVPRLLRQKHNLRERPTVGQTRFFRLIATLDKSDPSGSGSGSQIRGDLERKVSAIASDGSFTEQIRWRNVAIRPWLSAKGEYGPFFPVTWANNFSYEFSADSNYESLKWDLSSLPKDHSGYMFRAVLSVTAHYEFDFMRSVSHAQIDQLTRIGQLITDVPENRETFSLNLPPIVNESRLERKHVQVGLPGITIVNGEPAAILEFRQGPQDFALTMTAAERMEVKIKSWQYGQCLIRLRDGALISAQLTENIISNIGSSSSYDQGNYVIQEISSAEFEKGLTDWTNDRGHKQFIEFGQTHQSMRGSSQAETPCPTELFRKPRPNRATDFRLTITRQNMDPRGETTDTNQVRGEMTLTAGNSSSRGVRQPSITWRNVVTRISKAPGSPYENPETMKLVNGLSYLVPTGLSGDSEQIPDLSSLSDTQKEALVALIRTGSDFESLRSIAATPAARLRQPGDWYFLDSDKYSFPSFPGTSADSRLSKGTYLRFLGFTEVAGQPCVLIEFLFTPVVHDIATAANGAAKERITTWRYGVIAVGLSDGNLKSGEISERQLRSISDADGKARASRYVVTNYQLEATNSKRLPSAANEWRNDDSSRPAGRIYNR